MMCTDCMGAILRFVVSVFPLLIDVGFLCACVSRFVCPSVSVSVFSVKRSSISLRKKSRMF